MIMIALLRDYVLSCGLYIYIYKCVCMLVYLLVCLFLSLKNSLQRS